MPDPYGDAQGSEVIMTVEFITAAAALITAVASLVWSFRRKP